MAEEPQQAQDVLESEPDDETVDYSGWREPQSDTEGEGGDVLGYNTHHFYAQQYKETIKLREELFTDEPPPEQAAPASPLTDLK